MLFWRNFGCLQVCNLQVLAEFICLGNQGKMEKQKQPLERIEYAM